MKKERTTDRGIMDQVGLHLAMNCYDCARFFITHDRQHPYGCRAMGFKSARRPSRTVILSSGFPCQMFEPKSNRP